ncbi:MAG TPA: hypothetical protein VHY08_22705 [Bacillota bacterium]|nr:hypothetical protein [Bacillota bacterium]
MSSAFAIGTVVIVLAIFSLFAVGAARAEKVVAAKAKAIRDAQPKAVTKTTVVKTKKK